MIKIKINAISDKNTVLLGELIKFTIEVCNDEQNKLKNVEFSIVPCIGAVIIPRSIQIDDKLMNNNSYDKIFLGNIEPNKKIVITYIQKVEALTIENKINFKGKFKYLSGGKIKEQVIMLKTVKINILKLKICNFSDITEGALNEKVKVEFEVRNNGNIQLIDLELEEFWNKYKDFLHIDKVYINDIIFHYTDKNKVISKKFDINEICNIKIYFKVKKIPDKLLSLIPKIKIKYLKDDIIYEEKIIDGYMMYINIHSNLLKQIQKTFIINKDTTNIENTFYKIKVKETNINKVLVKKQELDTERIILKIVLNIIFKTDIYKEYENELLEFKVLLPQRYQVKKEEIYIGILDDMLKIYDEKTLLLKFHCNIYSNYLE